MAVQLV